MRQNTPQQIRSPRIFQWTIAGLLCVGLVGLTLGLPHSPAARADVEAQFTFFPINTATSTRTPTPINLGNFVWDDIDGDGAQDAGEPGVAGIQVQLWNSAKSLLVAATTTSGTGSYALVAPTPGNYRIRVILNAGDFFTAKDLAAGDDTKDSDINPSGLDAGFTDIISIASNVISMTSIDAGIVVFKTPTPTRTPTPINIGNFVWGDTNGNGIQDAGETGVGAAQVQLWNAAKTELFYTAYTNASGAYTVIAPTPGDYRIRVVVPIGVSFSPKDQGGDDLKDSDINPSGTNLGFSDSFTIASNVISTTSWDVGLINAPASFPTPSPTLTRTPTQTPTPSPTPTLTPIVLDQRLYLQSLHRP